MHLFSSLHDSINYHILNKCTNALKLKIGIYFCNESSLTPQVSTWE